MTAKVKHSTVADGYDWLLNSGVVSSECADHAMHLDEGESHATCVWCVEGAGR